MWPSPDVKADGETNHAKLTDWSDNYAAATCSSDFAKIDTIDTTVSTRLQMYSPMYFLCKGQAGYKTATIAHRRIRTGIMQGDTAITTEINLALALVNLGKTVDFATIWGQGQTMAELTGNATSNFIAWVQESLR